MLSIFSAFEPCCFLRLSLHHYSEVGASRQLGMNKRSGGHGPLQSAWMRLMEPCLEHERVPGLDDVAVNRAIVAEYNAELRSAGSAAPPPRPAVRRCRLTSC